MVLLSVDVPVAGGVTSRRCTCKITTHAFASLRAHQNWRYTVHHYRLEWGETSLEPLVDVFGSWCYVKATIRFNFSHHTRTLTHSPTSLQALEALSSHNSSSPLLRSFPSLDRSTVKLTQRPEKWNILTTWQFYTRYAKPVYKHTTTSRISNSAHSSIATEQWPPSTSTTTSPLALSHTQEVSHT